MATITVFEGPVSRARPPPRVARCAARPVIVAHARWSPVVAREWHAWQRESCQSVRYSGLALRREKAMRAYSGLRWSLQGRAVLLAMNQALLYERQASTSTSQDTARCLKQGS
jgi:hypothetical protein